MKKLLIASAFLLGCGSDQDSKLQIVNGQNTYRSWFVKLNGCGGTLISSDTVLTAKHCNHQVNFKAKIGLYKRNDPNNGGKPLAEKIKITKVIKHTSRDLQLLKLEKPSRFRPIKLYEGNLSKGDRLAAFGFGNTEYGGSAPEFLQGAVFYYTGEGAREGIIRANNRPYQAVCHGDSGSPVIFQGELVATVTFTEGRCSTKGSMGFTRLDIGWINKNI